jgi:hypothetical protein
MKNFLLNLFVVCTITNMFAQPGTALNFDGINDYIGRNIVSTATAGVSFEARVNWAGVAPSSRFIMYNGTSGTNGFGLYLASGSSSVAIKYGAAVYTSTYVLTPGVMTLLTVVVQGPNGLLLYANGTLVNSFFPPPAITPTGSFSIGSDNLGAQNFNGIFDEVRYWNRALCVAEIVHRTNCQAIGTEPNLVALYHFNQGIDAANNPTVTTLIDSSPSNFTATLSNFALVTGTVSNWIAAAGSLSTTCTYAPNSVTITPAGPVTLCAGSSASLTASGAATYTWNPGALTGSSVVITPTASGIYSVIGNSGNCYGVGGKSVTVNALPTVSATSNNSILCVGQNATLTASGAATYTWNPGGTGSTIAVTPSVNTNYTISATDANNCTNTAIFTQSVQICSGISQNSLISYQLSVYPNPNNGEFTISMNSISENMNVEIYNSLGQIVINEKVNTQSKKINMSQIPNGIYILKLKENNSVISTRKLVKD